MVFQFFHRQKVRNTKFSKIYNGGFYIYQMASEKLVAPKIWGHHLNYIFYLLPLFLYALKESLSLLILKTFVSKDDQLIIDLRIDLAPPPPPPQSMYIFDQNKDPHFPK